MMQKMKQFELFIWLEQLSALPQRERRRCNARDNTPSNTATQQHSNTATQQHTTARKGRCLLARRSRGKSTLRQSTGWHIRSSGRIP